MVPFSHFLLLKTPLFLSIGNEKTFFAYFLLPV